MSKLNWYASINRSKNNKSGTKIRLTVKRHRETLLFLKSQYEKCLEYHESNPEETPTFLLDQDAWDVIGKELKSGFSHRFVKIFFGEKEFCVLCHKEFKKEIYDTEYLRVEAEKKRLEEEEE